jgi:hypothetical protein
MALSFSARPASKINLTSAPLAVHSTWGAKKVVLYLGGQAERKRNITITAACYDVRVGMKNREGCLFGNQLT